MLPATQRVSAGDAQLVSCHILSLVIVEKLEEQEREVVFVSGGADYERVHIIRIDVVVYIC